MNEELPASEANEAADACLLVPSASITGTIKESRCRLEGIRVLVHPDPYPDLSYLGTFGDEPQERAIMHDPTNARVHHYFYPVDQMEAQQAY